MSVISDLIEKIIGRERAYYYIKSGEPRPTASTHDLHNGDKLEEADTGYQFVWYGGKWNLKSKGSYSAVKFTLTFEKGELASAVDPASKEVTYDAAYGDLADTTPDTGYEFEGWYFDAEFTNEVKATDVVRIEANTTVYANHIPIVYNITYELDDGENDPDNPATFIVVTPTITLADAVKEGYTFGGWFSDAGMTQEVTKITLGSHADITLYAKFTAIEYDITYNLDGGTNAANPATYTIATATITLLDATKDGYTFLGWFSDAGLTTEVTEIALGSTGDITLYAGWEVEG